MDFYRHLMVLCCSCSFLSVLNAQELKVQEKDFADIIYESLRTGEKEISIPRGSYYMALEGGEPLHLKKLSGVVIDCNGSEIITRKASQAIQITECENVVLKNLSIDCQTLPFTQGTIVDMDREHRMWWEVEIMEGYPMESLLTAMPDRIQVFDPATLTLRKNLYTYWRGTFASVICVGDRRFRFTKKNFNADSNEQVGDYLTMTLESEAGTRPHSIVMYRSKKVHLENVTIWSGNCFGFFEDQCEANSYHRCVIDRKMNDPHVSFPRLRAINADAFHSKAAVVGPTVTNCIFRYHADDCIAINTSFYKVMTAEGTTVDVVSPVSQLKMKPGDTLRFVKFDGSIAGESVLLKMETATDFSRQDLDAVNSKYHFTVDKRKHSDVTRLTLSSRVDVDNGGVVSSLTRGGNGFVIRNNILGHTRARGILIKASDGVVENNEVVGCELGGIVLAPELVWLEAGFSHNVLVQNNRIIDCMFANSSYGIEQAAPLCVVAINARNEVAPAGGFRQIRVCHNTIINSPEPAMIFTSIDGGVVEHNTVVVSDFIHRTHGRILKNTQASAIWLKNNKNLVCKDNLIKINK